MGEQHERGYFYDPKTGEVTPVPEAPHGWVIEPEPLGQYGEHSWWWPKPSTFTIRPATKEEAEG